MSAHTAPPSRNHPSRSPPLALGALLAWAGTARAQSETELWSSNLTVGVATVRRYEMRGYTTAEPEVDGTLGRLTDNDFGYASGGYRVTSLFGFRDDPPERSRLRLWSQVAVRPAQALAAAPDGAARLDASGLGLAELPPLGRFAALERLDLSDNALADIAPLAALGTLRELDLSGNRIADLGPLAALGALERLDLAGNRVTDLAPLADLAGLRVLVLDRNRVTDLWPLSHLGGLEQLGLADNAVTDVTALQDLGRLRRLDLGGGRVADLSPLGDVGSLEWLALPDGPADAAAALGRLTGLRWLWPGTPHRGGERAIPGGER